MKMAYWLGGVAVAALSITTLCMSQSPRDTAAVASPAKPAPVLDPTVDFTGTWKNQRDSTMTIKRASDGSLSGDYTTLVGSQHNVPFTRKLVGQSNGDQLTFYVDFSPYSMTAWVGQLLTDSHGKETLDTVWVNTVNVPEKDEPDDGWAGVRNGGDRFIKQTP